MSQRLQENLFLARTFKNWNEHIEMMKKTNSQKVSFIFERMNGFLKQSSCYELLFYITIVAKEKKMEEKFGRRNHKKIHSFCQFKSSTRMGKNSSFFAVNCCQNLYKVKKRKVILFQ